MVWVGGDFGGEEYIPLNPTITITVVLCARSAQTRPRTTILSHRDTLASRSANLAARSRATFSMGVSARGAAGLGPGRPAPGGGLLGGVEALGLGKRCGWEGALEAEEEAAERRGVGLL